MNNYISLDPQIKLSAADFVAAWNETPPVDDSVASLEHTPPATMLSPELTVALITVGVTIPATILTSFVTELLKKRFIDGDAPKVTVTTIETPEGEPLWIIRQTEE